MIVSRRRWDALLEQVVPLILEVLKLRRENERLRGEVERLGRG